MRQDLLKPFIENDAPLQKQFEQVKSYLYQFREQVEMMLQNIDVDNMAPQLAEPLDILRSGSKILSVSGNGSRVDINVLSDMIKTRVLESTEFGEIESSITQMSSEIALKVSSGDLTAQFLIGRLNSGSTYATIDADRIDIDGVFTANGSFTIDQNGNLTFTGAGIDIETSSDSNNKIELYGPGRFSRMSPSTLSIGSSTSNDFVSLNCVNSTPSSFYAQLGVNTNVMMGMTRDSSDNYKMVIGDHSLSQVSIYDGNAMVKPISWRKFNTCDGDMYVLTGGY